MKCAVLLRLWWLLSNGLVSWAAFDFLSAAAPAPRRGCRALWLAVSSLLTLTALVLGCPAGFFLSLLALAGFGRLVLRIPAAALALPLTVLTVFATLLEGISALVMSWLSRTLPSPALGTLLQIALTLTLDLLLFSGLGILRRRYAAALGRTAGAGFDALPLSCALLVWASRSALGLDSPAFEGYLAGLDAAARLTALWMLLGTAAAALILLRACSAAAGLSGQGRELERLRGQRRWLEAAGRANASHAAFRHDVDNHLLVISGLLRARQFDQAQRYAGALRVRAARLPALISTGRPPLDALLAEKLALAGERQMETRCQVCVPADFPVDDVDLCALFANLLDNAIGACGEVEPARRRITLSAGVRAGFLTVEVVNAAAGSRRIRPGTGLANVRRLAEAYRGTVEIRPGGDVVRVRVLLCAP
ncbi:GHKL domain-containing protein [Pseudoflavonifractor sp. 524-17]|uniref:GHKL domain-containing protein n=1 Tax=Pseudoflavonifractor sp. 524-17 TaxID=2304577 RepID=UPI0013795835|nr:GHKL domain-containing protein [Pseudoflavonifractor sp. 524-17]